MTKCPPFSLVPVISGYEAKIEDLGNEKLRIGENIGKIKKSAVSFETASLSLLFALSGMVGVEKSKLVEMPGIEPGSNV